MDSGEYEIRESTRAKQLRITVDESGHVIVTKPVRTSMLHVKLLLKLRAGWITKARAKMLARAKRAARTPREQLPRLRRGSKAHEEAKIAARKLVIERLKHFSALYGFAYGTVSIRNQKSRWGSCSRQNNVSFNYRIIYLPPPLADYLIVHELCHTCEHNHSSRFWALVGRTIPEHKVFRKQLMHGYRF